MAELDVSRKNIRGLLSLDDPSTKGKYFAIPEYQRPYRWDEDTCDTLWNDLTNFYDEHQDDAKEYFLGSIVTCADNEDPNRINVIDGQQRITSFLLLLRAFYHKLERQCLEEPNNKRIAGVMTSIAPCIWEVDPEMLDVPDMKRVHIKTFVAIDDAREDFELILEKGEPITNSNSYYAKNYSFFLNHCDHYAKDHLDGWRKFALFILNRCIVLPIQCSDLDSALTIFGTLNNRGLPLADSDIFKAELYKIQEFKQGFADRWKELEQSVEGAGFKLDDVFRYYMYIDRAKNNDTSNEKSLRSYYAGRGNGYQIFKDPHFFDDLIALGEFWTSIYKNEEEYCTNEALRYIQCLLSYPNEYWKYPVSIFFYKNRELRNSSELKERFTEYLKKLLSFVFVKFIESPTRNDVRPHIFNFCVETYNSSTIDCSFYSIPSDFKVKINNYSRGKITKALLLLHCYLFDRGQRLIRRKVDIEHIFPKHWQDTNYNGWDKEMAEEHLEMFGNKIIFEKRLNIQAGNGYFGKKKELYKSSELTEVRALSQVAQSDWVAEDIERRNGEIIDRLYRFFLSNLPQSETH